MTNAQDPPAGSDASHANTPPQQPSQLPTRSGSTRGAAELAGDHPEPPPPALTTHEHNGTPERPRNKSEGSGYASSYRPSESSASISHVQSADHHLDAPAVDYENPDHPPPAYTEIPGQLSEDTADMGTNAVVADDGRVNIRINQKNRRLSQIFVPQIHHQISAAQHEPAPPPPYVPEFLGGAPGQQPPPPLNVVIHVVGSRGDVQPFVALGKVLKETYNHRVRLATHPTFKDFVTENGLEFFSIGGDPAELMAFMVKNPGLMPGFDTLRSGDVGKRRRGIAEILRGTWRSCIETGDGLGTDPLKQTVEEWMGVEASLPEPLKKPFVADAIIANPPSFGHIHCAEKLGIPLHMMFTMPWSPTQQFPHPLANIQSSNADASITNFMSYTLVDMLTWQGLGDIINRFRRDSLGLDSISMIWAPGMLARLKIPYTYCWSPALIPKPSDWANHISISGFYFLNLASNYTPEPALAEFLAAGEPPVYIGFGSIVVDDPNAMTNMIFEAVKLTGRRALVSKGWGGLGADELGIPEGVFMLGNCPHDWLFKHVSAVVHHGGAGTTAAGIAAGRPTVVVPFFGDQPFWGAMTAKAGAGPLPIPYKDLTAEKLADAIKEALKPESLDRAKELSQKISTEQGSQEGAVSFHQFLKPDELRCAVAPSHPAVWRLKRTQVRLSAMAATVLAQEGELNFSELKLFRPREYETDEGPWDPISGGATAIIGTASTMMMGVADFPIETLKLLNIHPDAANKGKGKARDGESGTSESTSNTRKKGHPGRNRTEKLTTNTNLSATSSASTLPGVHTPNTSVTDITVTSPSGSTPTRSSSEMPQVIRPQSPGTPTHRTSFMAQAMAASSQVSHSRSPSRERHGRAKSISAAELRFESGTTFGDRLHDMNPDAAVKTSKGIGRIVGAGFKSPMDFSLNVAKGFHNLPKLYGGEVRRVDKVTDLETGVKTAVKELGVGFYDGITGLVMDPYKGAKKEGGVGFIKGVGKGIAGLPTKVMGGVFALPGYAMKGLYQEALKNKGANVQNYIIAARISQGYDEASGISQSQREGILSQWKCIRKNVKKKKNVGEEQIDALHTLMKERKAKRNEKWGKVNSHFKRPEARPSFPPAMTDNSSYEDGPARGTTRAPGDDHTFPLQHANTYPRPSASQSALSQPSLEERLAADEAAEREELEAAIRASVSETSHGNPEEDDMIEQAIRASITELERPVSSHEDEEQLLQRVMTASIDEAGKRGASEEEKKALEETLKNSLLETRRAHGSDSEWNESDTEDDEDYQRVLAESLQANHPADYSGYVAAGAQEEGVLHANDEDEVLKKAIAESEAAEKARLARVESGADAHDDGEEDALRRALEESEEAEKARMAELAKHKSEEDIVLEYVKKQSLAEEQHRMRMLHGRDVGGESSSAGQGGSGSAS
ncbi:glycosyltransferase family 1 protein [Lophiostoma macrostomum CBS 122681]|uniref:Glycosyltransferase family 1 protein n=1 Tax=Lophiostoma macrostomum CBS 122681 TaxID=1314788 RepID=A0A6A6TQ83_9PLEO|nr:glycosyltransferase family 1 protein [Lophiostoma macrostomum CBS 122681]